MYIWMYDKFEYRVTFMLHRTLTITRVGNGYDQAQLRSIKMADAEHGEFRLSRIVSTRHLVRRPYCAWRQSWDRLIFWMWETAAARSDIADIGMRKFRRIGRNCHALLIVTAFQSRRLLIVTCLNESWLSEFRWCFRLWKPCLINCNTKKIFTKIHQNRVYMFHKLYGDNTGATLRKYFVITVLFMK